MQHPFVNPKDFNQALTELDLTKKEWVSERGISYEWLRKVLNGLERSPRIEGEIVSTVKEAEEERIERHINRKKNLEQYEQRIKSDGNNE